MKMRVFKGAGDDLMAPNQCAVCGQYVDGCHRGVPEYWCTACYRQWKADIDDKAPWVHQLRLWESARRKRRNNHLKHPEWWSVSWDRWQAVVKV